MKCPHCGTEFYGEKCPNCGFEPGDYDVAIDTLMQLTGVGRKRAEELYKAGFRDIESIARSDEQKLSEVNTIGREMAKKIKQEAQKYAEPEEKEFVRICPVCGAIVPPDKDFCPRCGTPMSGKKEESIEEEPEEVEEDSILNKVICPFCGALIDKGSDVCPVCGANLQNVAMEKPKPMEDPEEVIKRFFGVDKIPEYSEEEEQADIRVCPNCGAVVVNKDVCPLCGAEIPKTVAKGEEEGEIDLSETLNVCPNCGAFVQPDVSTCPICGAEISKEEEEEAVEAISLAALINPTVPEATEQEEETISLEDLGEIESTVSAELGVEEGEYEVGTEDLDEIMSSIESEEKDLSEEEIEQEDLKSIEKELEKIEKPQEVEKPKIVTPPPVVTPRAPPPIPTKKTFSEKLNAFLYGFGTVEDILSFSPLLVSLIFMVSIGAFTGAAEEILIKTVSILSFSLGLVMAVYLYKSTGKFGKREKILGAALSAMPLAIMLPYPEYILIAVAVVGVYIHLKWSVDYWIPYTASAIAFALQPLYAASFSVIFAALFSLHIITRYEETNMEIPVEIAVHGESFKDMGIKAFREKRYYDAIYLLRRALRNEPENVSILNTLGLAYGRIGNTDMALEMFKKAVEVNPGYKYSWNNMGNVYARQENYDKAIECYKKALEIDPEYDDAMLNLGYVMIRRGNYGEAIKMAEKIKAAP